MKSEERLAVGLVVEALRSLLIGEVSSCIQFPDKITDETILNLCQTTNLLLKTYKEANSFLISLSQGLLDVFPPPRNFLVSPFKNLQANLSHLVWQTQQVAKGDLSQRVDFLGSFSISFNSMIESLREKKLIEEALKLSEERLGLAVEGAHLGLWDCDLTNNKVTFNRRSADLLGLDSENLRYTTEDWFSRVHADDRPDFLGQWTEHLHDKTGILRCEFRLEDIGNSLKWILCMGKVVVTGEKNVPVRIAGTFLDITDIKNAEVELRGARDDLEIRVAQRTAELKEANKQLRLEMAHRKIAEEQIIRDRDQLEVRVAERTADFSEANLKIMDSIKYARNIQLAFLPEFEEISRHIKDFFIIWKPKDVIGGDIFKFKAVPEGFVLSVIDCTGHGVPGAIMTMIAGNAFDRALELVGYFNPSAVLNKIDHLVKAALNQHHAQSPSDDGLDIGFCFVNRKDDRLTFGGARIGLHYTVDGVVSLLRPNKQSVGYKSSVSNYPFTNHTVSLRNTPNLYLVTDGLTDQTGGPRGLPFGSRNFRRLLAEIAGNPFREQQHFLEASIETYRGQEPQVDDITCIGFSV